ncbi:MAG: hypothetical protein U9Q81_04295 [Pseudomonadota bacterium]|nr:hypothetical protein [Pseudomonadota bacterium]
MIADAPFGFYYYDYAARRWRPGFDVSEQGPLIELIPPLEVLYTDRLWVGSYDFYFGVDENRNGMLDQPLYYDSVEVNVAP